VVFNTQNQFSTFAKSFQQREEPREKDFLVRLTYGGAGAWRGDAPAPPFLFFYLLYFIGFNQNKPPGFFSVNPRGLWLFAQLFLGASLRPSA
jgi:hypothetical protein